MTFFLPIFNLKGFVFLPFFLPTAHEEANVFLALRICHGYLYTFFHYAYVYFLYMCACAGRYMEKEKKRCFFKNTKK